MRESPTRVLRWHDVPLGHDPPCGVGTHARCPWGSAAGTGDAYRLAVLRRSTVTVVIVACACFAGCNLSFGWRYDAGPPAPTCVWGTEPAPVRACDAPTAPSADDVVDVHSFRVVASAAVCDLSLRCGFGFDTYCHPRYAEWEANASEPVAFDLDAARACVRAVARGSCNEALVAAVACHEISLHGACPDCPLGCDGCAAAREGEACDPTATTPGCDAGLVCNADGRCERAPLEVCDGRTILPIGHFGCACATDAECPAWTGACVADRCVPRPFADAPCGPDDAPCFESICDGARCRPFGVGEGPCSADASCAPGLVCGLPPAFFQPGSLLCGAPIPVGSACGPAVPGRCADGLRCRDDGFCVPG